MRDGDWLDELFFHSQIFLNRIVVNKVDARGNLRSEEGGRLLNLKWRSTFWNTFFLCVVCRFVLHQEQQVWSAQIRWIPTPPSFHGGKKVLIQTSQNTNTYTTLTNLLPAQHWSEFIFKFTCMSTWMETVHLRHQEASHKVLIGLSKRSETPSLWRTKVLHLSSLLGVSVWYRFWPLWSLVWVPYISEQNLASHSTLVLMSNVLKAELRHHSCKKQ